MLHGAHWRAGGGLDVKASDATALAGEAHLLRVVVRVKAMAMARASVEMRLGFGAGARDRGEGEARTSVRLCVACTGCALRPSLAVPGGVAKSATKEDFPPSGRSSGTCKVSVAHARRMHGERTANASQGSMCTVHGLRAPSR